MRTCTSSWLVVVGWVPAWPSTLESEGHTVAVVDRHRKAFRRLPDDFTGKTSWASGFDRDTPEVGRHRGRRRRWRRSPTATTRTSSSPGSPARPSSSSTSSPASTTRAGPQIYERLGIPTVATVVVDHRAGAAQDPARHARGRVGRSRAPRCAWSSGRCPPTGPAAAVELEMPGVVPLVAVARLGEASLPEPRQVAQEGDVVWVAVAGDRMDEFDQTLVDRARTQEAALMRVIIVGGGNVGTYIAAELAEAGHEVLIVEIDPDRVGVGRRRPACPPGVDLARRRRLRGHPVRHGRARDGRRGRGRHRRRRGQPRDLAAGQAGVRRAPRRRPHQQPRERVAVQRDVGRRRRRCRRRTCSPRWSRRPCRSARSSASCRSRATGPGCPRSSWPPTSPADGKDLQHLEFPRGSTVVAILRGEHLVVPRGDTVLPRGRRGDGARHRRQRREGPRRCSSADGSGHWRTQFYASRDGDRREGATAVGRPRLPFATDGLDACRVPRPVRPRPAPRLQRLRVRRRHHPGGRHLPSAAASDTAASSARSSPTAGRPTSRTSPASSSSGTTG